MSAPTLSAVAQQAGVSLATASRVLNGSDRRPAEPIAARVRAAAAELGYVPNAQAQALARSASGLIGLVVHDIADPYFSTIARGVEAVAHARSRQMLLAATDPSDEAGAVATFISYRTDAIILAGSRRRDTDAELDAELRRYEANRGRVVSIGGHASAGAAVSVANADGAAALARELASREITSRQLAAQEPVTRQPAAQEPVTRQPAAQGSRRFAILAGPSELATAADRVRGFTTGLRESHISPMAVIHTDFTREGGYAGALELLRDVEPNADICLLAVNDVMALGAMAAVRDRGLSVPGDVQVSGFDDIPTLRDTSPGLTTVRLPLEQIGAAAARLALDDGSEECPAFSGEVMIRESAGSGLEGSGR